jgi:GT2 family glycosyltransferase
LPENRGFTGGNIAGYGEARSELIVLLNNDTEAEAHWLEELHKASREYPKAGVFASKMLLLDDRQRIDNCGFGMTTGGTTVDFGRGELDGPEWSEPKQVFGACAGAAAYRRSMLEHLGFLDPDFFNTYEDVDLSFRAQLMGYGCIFAPRAVVYHRYRATMKKYPAKQVYFSQKNIESVYLKNMPLELVLRYLPQRILYEIGAAIYFTRLGVGGAFIKAKLDVIRELPAIFRKRKAIQRRRIVSNQQLRSAMEGHWVRGRWKKLVGAWRKPVRTDLKKHKSSPVTGGVS